MRARVHLLPIVLMIVVASTQIVLARAYSLSPWKGGGFGMFSTIDSPDARAVTAHLAKSSPAKGPPQIEIPRRLYKANELTYRTLPTPRAFAKLTDALMQTLRQKHGEDLSPGDRLVVQSWRYRHSIADRRLVKELVATQERSVDAP